MQRNRHTARLAYLERHKLWRMPALTAAWLGACAVEIVAMDGCYSTLNLNGHKDAGATQGLRTPVP